MRVIFTGQTGVEHRLVLRKLQAFALKQGNLQEEGLMVFSVEEEIEKLGFDFISFLDSVNDKAKEGAWRQAFQNILSKADNAKHVFLSMHLCFLRLSNFSSPSDWELIREFRPQKFVTLIDDLYSIWARIQRRESTKAPTGSYFRLREIAAWRSMEILMTDRLAKYVYSDRIPKESSAPDNYVVAVKHPPSMLYRLLFEPQRLVVYAAFPITTTRNDPEVVKEINKEFRQRLYKEFTVFDPVTVDERILQFAYKEQFKRAARDEKPTSEVKVELRKEYRWPLTTENGDWSLCGDEDFPIYLDPSEVQEVAKDIDDHIKLRDYRLIRQSDCLVAYRPNYRKESSKGVFAEVLYARDTAYKPRYFVHHAPEDGEQHESPFSGEGVFHGSMDTLMEALKKKQGEKNKNYIGA